MLTKSDAFQKLSCAITECFPTYSVLSCEQ